MRYDGFVTKAVGVWCKLLVSGDASVSLMLTLLVRDGCIWILLGGSAFRQIREFVRGGEKPILKFLQLRMTFMTQWHISDPTAV